MKMLIRSSALLLMAAFPVCSSFAQVEITSSDLPDAGDLLIQEVATLNGDADYLSTGAGTTWTFGAGELTLTGTLNETNCLNVSSTPLIYQAFFNAAWDPEHDSDYAVGIDALDLGTITLEDAYFYYQNRPDRYAITGGGATIMGIPTGAQGDPVDVVYNLPIQFGDSDESYSELLYEVPTLGAYQTQQTRSNVVDGWGTLNLFGESYEVLRVRTVINAIDSIYIEFIQTGTTFERPEAVEYKWLSPDFKVPVLQVNETAGVVTQVLVKGGPASITGQEVFPFTWFFHTGEEAIRLSGAYDATDRFMLHDQGGRLVAQGYLASASIPLHDVAAGAYLFSVMRHGQVFTGRFVKPVN